LEFIGFGTILVFGVCHENVQKLEKRWEEESTTGI
jgi:hypothetical protein